MYRLSWIFSIVVASALPKFAAAEPPVVAPKPRTGHLVPGCAECRFLVQPSRTTRIVPVQAGPTLPSVEDVPGPLPHAFDVKPLPGAAGRTPLSDLVDEYLPGLSADEQRVWVEELHALPPEIARDLLTARSRAAGPQTLPNALEGGLVPPPEQSEPLPEPRAVLRRIPVGTSQSRDLEGVTVDVLKQVEAVLVHNIANAQTHGYKRLMPLTREAVSNGGLQGFSVRRVEQTGRIERTGRELDLAIEGAGLFQVRNGDTIALTRCGTFEIGVDRLIVANVDGVEWSLYPPVEIPLEATSVQFEQNGQVTFRLPGEGDEVVVGQVELARVNDFTSLESAGNGLYAVPEQAEPVGVGRPNEDSLGAIRQGCLEQSNVVVSSEAEALKLVRLQISLLTEGSPDQLATPAPDQALR